MCVHADKVGGVAEATAASVGLRRLCHRLSDRSEAPPVVDATPLEPGARMASLGVGAGRRAFGAHRVTVLGV